MNFGDDEIGRAIHKSYLDNRFGRAAPNPTPYVDPKDLGEHQADQMADGGMRPEVWKQVMEYHSFTWYEPKELDVRIGLEKFTPRHLKDLVDAYGRPLRLEGVWAERPHAVGQWRNDLGSDGWRVPEKLKMAFTLHDLVTLHLSPERFDSWFRDQVRAARAARAGIRLASR